jgi:hypothetical protein
MKANGALTYIKILLQLTSQFVLQGKSWNHLSISHSIRTKNYFYLSSRKL